MRDAVDSAQQQIQDRLHAFLAIIVQQSDTTTTTTTATVEARSPTPQFARSDQLPRGGGGGCPDEGEEGREVNQVKHLWDKSQIDKWYYRYSTVKLYMALCAVEQYAGF